MAEGKGFPYASIILGTVWVVILITYAIVKWKRSSDYRYQIPRVFVLCSPNTVQFTYELILRVGLPSMDLKPEKHDLDVSVLGLQRNEVIPLTRLNLRPLCDEPLMTGLSLLVYRLVEMPALGGLLLKHSGPLKAWLYAYDFTVIDCTTNREYLFPLNQYIGSINRTCDLLDLSESQIGQEVKVNYPIDDVPLPDWNVEDAFAVIATMVAYITLLLSTVLPLNCEVIADIFSVALASVAAGGLLCLLNWFTHYLVRWNMERREYFSNINKKPSWLNPTILRIVLFVSAFILVGASTFASSLIRDSKETFVWFLANTNVATLVTGCWFLASQLELGDTIVAFGLRLKGVESIPIGILYSEMISDLRSKSTTTSDDSTLGRAAATSRPGISMLDSKNRESSRIASANHSQTSVQSFGFKPTNSTYRNLPKSSTLSSIKMQSALHNKHKNNATQARKATHPPHR